MAAKNKNITKCRFYAITGKLHFECGHCGTRWWATKSGCYKCTTCNQWMIVKVIKKNRKPVKSLFFFNSDPIWKKAINKYLEV